MINVLPVHAGMIPASHYDSGNPQCAPRTCGDDPTDNNGDMVTVLCSPHVRG